MTKKLNIKKTFNKPTETIKMQEENTTSKIELNQGSTETTNDSVIEESKDSTEIQSSIDIESTDIVQEGAAREQDAINQETLQVQTVIGSIEVPHIENNDPVQEEVLDSKSDPINPDGSLQLFLELGVNLRHRLDSKDEVVGYADVCGRVYKALKSLRDTNKDEITGILRSFCKEFRYAVTEGRIDRDNYSRGLNMLRGISSTQMTTFIGMLFEMYKNQIILTDFKNGKSTLDKYFTAYPINGNRSAVIGLMSKVLSE